MNTTTSEKLLLGPGPCNCSEGVLNAIGSPLLGHLDPDFLSAMEDTKRLLREVFQTENNVTFPVSGTGSAGMEFLLLNFLSAGDKLVVGVNGVFGGRIAALATKIGAEVIKVEADWGKPIDNAEFIAAINEHKPQLAAIVSAETSTGVYQNMDGISEATHANGGLLFLDCVTSLAGMPVCIDEWGVDVAFSGTQKCLACPPGLSPVTISPRAIEVFKKRENKPATFYFDLDAILGYIDGEGGRSYHHTAPINMVLALRQALVEIVDEGLEARWARHADAAAYLIESLEQLGFEPLVSKEARLNSLTTIKLPEGLDEAKVRGLLLNEDQIEVGAGLGSLAGKVWRIGLMGGNATRESVDKLITALKKYL